MYILGINAYHGDASATLIKDGKLIAAAEEERFNRHKHCAGFPALAIKYCLATAGIGIGEVDHIGISRNPSANLSNKILFSAKKAVSSLWGGGGGAESGEASSGQSGFKRLSERLASVGKVRNFKDDLAGQLGVDKNEIRAELHHVEHHRAHLASCFFVSPFERAALLSIDGFGDFVSTMWGEGWGVGAGAKFEVHDQVEFPHSTGILYTATT